jgi:hypothetical protein
MNSAPIVIPIVAIANEMIIHISSVLYAISDVISIDKSNKLKGRGELI